MSDSDGSPGRGEGAEARKDGGPDEPHPGRLRPSAREVNQQSTA